MSTYTTAALFLLIIFLAIIASGTSLTPPSGPIIGNVGYIAAFLPIISNVGSIVALLPPSGPIRW
jgi:hypothetical protein